MATSRQVKEGKQLQGSQEVIAYQIPTTPWGSTPTAVTVTAYDITGGGRTDVTSTKLTGSPSVTDDVITLPVFASTVKGRTYRIETKFTAGGNTWVCWFDVEGED